MRVKTFRRASMTEAMAAIRATLGPEAMILGSRRRGAEIEVTAAIDHAGGAPASPGQSREEVLRWHGIAQPLRALLTNGPLEAALAGAFSFATLPLGGEPAPLLLAGPPGAGKTLTLVKLATRLVLAGVAPLIASADARRAGAVEQLSAFARALELPLTCVSDPAKLAAILAHRGPRQPALIDTAGINPLDPVDRDELAALSAATEATTALVLPAGLDAAEACDVAGAFADLGATLLLPTRLDLTWRLGGTLAAAFGGRLSLTEAGTSPAAAGGLTPLTPAFLAERLGQIRAAAC